MLTLCHRFVIELCIIHRGNKVILLIRNLKFIWLINRKIRLKRIGGSFLRDVCGY